MTINHVSLTTEKLNGDAYQLNVIFFKQTEIQSRKVFVFSKQSKSREDEIVDIYSLNCGKSTSLTGIFTNKDIKLLKPNIPKINLAYSTVFTLDMKDPEKGYIHEEIDLGEKKVCAFFSDGATTKSKSLSKAQKLLNNKLNFIYCEGTLKGKLLYQFADQEVEYLNSNEGNQDFCKLAEVFMNGAKFGHIQEETGPEQYIYSVSKSKTFKPHQKSTIWYPKPYKKIVNAVATIFQPVFTTTSSFDGSTGISILTMKEKV